MRAGILTHRAWLMSYSRNDETDPVGRWIMERFNVVADFERAFGITPSRASHVLVGADSDDTGTRTRAFVRNILFAPK